MTPNYNHRFSLLDRGIVVELSWIRMSYPFKQRFRAHVKQSLFGGGSRYSPSNMVAEQDFLDACLLLEHEDIAAAVEVFKKLGYRVSVTSTHHRKTA